MGDQDEPDVCMQCSQLEDQRILLQVGDDWIITLTPYAARILAGLLLDVTVGRRYASSTLSPAEAILMAS